jgi:NADPH:quinone reductase-like Zn-dependent oxidoreductase
MPSNTAAWLVAAKTSPLEVKEAPLTQPGEGYILVKNSAVAMNPVDIANQQYGVFIKESQYPVILGEDVAGTVEAVGSGVTQFKAGDRVLGYTTSLATNDNANSAFQEYTVIRAECASKIPDNLSFEQAAVLPLAIATTAWALFGDATLKMKYPSLTPETTGETVLIWGGSSSVGGTAIQLAKAAGYEVITTASTKNHEYVKSLGADHVFEYKSPQVTKEIASLLTGKKFAGALEASGSDEGMTNTSQSIAHAEGLRKMICVRGASSPSSPEVEAQVILSTSIINTPVAKAVFADYVPAALEQGKFKAVPKAEVVGKGLESIQLGIDTLAKGVSAKKIVVSL